MPAKDTEPDPQGNAADVSRETSPAEQTSAAGFFCLKTRTEQRLQGDV